MTKGKLPLIPVLAALLTALPAGLSAQTPTESPKSFDRMYIDGSEYRHEANLLYDWPELTRLVVWARRLESAVAEADQTLSAELLTDFRARVDSLQGGTLPAFLGTRADSVRTGLRGIASALEAAEASLTGIPEAQVTPLPGEASADPGHQRTLVTGGTAVTVPAGVAVGGARDSLPSVTFEGGETMTFVDRVTLALVELDRVVHLTRGAGIEATPAPSGRAARPAAGIPPPRP